MDDDLKKLILDESGRNKLVRAFMNGEEVKPEDKFAFGCRACGECCINTDTVITPPEEARILWFMFRTGMPLQVLGEAFPGYKTGVPNLRIGKHKGKGVYAGKDCCIFLSPVLKTGDDGKLEESGKWVCDIYPVRPCSCRSYPVGKAIPLSPENET